MLLPYFISQRLIEIDLFHISSVMSVIIGCQFGLSIWSPVNFKEECLFIFFFTLLKQTHKMAHTSVRACSVMSNSLRLHGLYKPSRFLCPPGKNRDVCSGPFLLQGIFLTHGLNTCLLHWQVDSFTTEPSEKPDPHKSTRGIFSIVVTET